ncbi:hypothetical protein SAMN04489724_2018 [Algoriphagus locisalis]|uniref:Uncharacterized protein n=1 Tax=Algoriphagus locisalis TaxID=305507 RepID=A0A1I7AJM4_9BACT|nr:hypothetical protein SAMN04489724_2018 [Algoriphagus locisalis]
MERIANGFLWILMLVFALNSVYVFLFTDIEDDFLVLGLFDVSKWTAGFIYLGFACVLLLALKSKKDSRENR